MVTVKFRNLLTVMQAIASILTYDVEMYVVNILQFCKISVKLTFLLNHSVDSYYKMWWCKKNFREINSSSKSVDLTEKLLLFPQKQLSCSCRNFKVFECVYFILLYLIVHLYNFSEFSKWLSMSLTTLAFGS